LELSGSNRGDDNTALLAVNNPSARQSQ